MLRSSTILAAVFLFSLQFVFVPVSGQSLCFGPNECDPRVDRSCRPVGGCERFCHRMPCMRPFIDCYCRSGYARNVNGRCVPLSSCPRVCGEFECPNRSPSCRCEAYCRPRSGCIQAPNGCHCARGYARNDRNRCVPVSMCPFRG